MERWLQVHEEFLTLIADRPALWPVAFLPLTLLLCFSHREAARVVLAAAGILLLVLFGTLVVAYACSPVYADHVEPSIACLGWYAVTGKPVYPPLDYPERYILPYGPYLYLSIGASQRLLGPSEFSTKLPAVLTVGLALVVLAGLLYRRDGGVAALAGCGLVCAGLLYFAAAGFWPRPEPFLLLAVVLALTGRPLLVGLACALAIHLKIHALLYLLPAAGYITWDRRFLAVAGATAAVGLVAPFLLPNVSLVNYLASLTEIAGQEFSAENLIGLCEGLVVLAVPLLAAGNLPRMLLVAIALLLIPASKIGSGPHHLLPLLPAVALFAVEGFARREKPATPWVVAVGLSAALCATAAAWVVSRTVVRTCCAPGPITDAEMMRADLAALLARYGTGHTLLMGAGDDFTYRATFHRDQLVFAGHPIGLDPMSVMDAVRGNKTRLDLDALCRHFDKPVAWIIPAHPTPLLNGSVQPFLLKSWYPPRTDLVYPPQFREEFLRRFRRVEFTTYYELWMEP